jgi:4,5-DOPA dioxygenase extradiol
VPRSQDASRETSPDAQPVLFCAHGSPMNAVRDNAFTRFLAAFGRTLKPRALLVVSAHWERERPAVTSGAAPATVHDFWGFPEALYRLRYPAPGSPALAGRVRELLGAAGLSCDAAEQQGFDHGAWSPLLRLRPAADLPLVELSLLIDPDLDRHVFVGRALEPLRREGVLVLGSGNLVHNLRTVDFADEHAEPPGWARECDAFLRDALLAFDLAALSALHERVPHWRLAHPSLEHYAPLLVAAGAAGRAPAVSFPYEGFEHGSIGMRCVRFD